MKLRLLCLFSLLCLLCGCGLYVSNESFIESKLNKKYGIDTIVSDLNDVHKIFGLDNNSYTGIATIKGTNDTFEVMTTPKTGAVVDNYHKIIYGNEINDRIENILRENSVLCVLESNYKYELTEYNYISVDDYLENSSSMLFLDISSAAPTNEYLAQELSDLFLDLRKNHIRYSVTCYYVIDGKEKNIIFTTVMGSDKIHDYETVLNKINIIK